MCVWIGRYQRILDSSKKGDMVYSSDLSVCHVKLVLMDLILLEYQQQ